MKSEPGGSAGLRRRFRIEWVWVSALASAIITAALMGGWTRPADDLLYDAAMRLTPAEADASLLIVAIDEPSLQALGRWPWPRALHAQLLDRLAEARPRSIALDLLLTEPAADDPVLAAAMGRVPVGLPVQFLVPGRDGRAVERLDPAPALARKAARHGHVNTVIDPDGTVRAAALCFAPTPGAKPLDHLVRIGTPATAGIPCDARRLRFAPPESFATISYVSLLRGEVPPALIAGRRVLIGMTAQGLGDRYPVPVSAGGNMPGVEINANIANAQLNDGWIASPPLPVRLAIALIPAWLLMVAFWRVRPRAGSLLALALMVATLAVSTIGLAGNMWIAPGPALLGLVLVYPLWGWRRLQATSDYMALELARLEQEEALPLTGRDPIDTDHVTRQARQLARAIAQLRDLKRLVGDALAGLPDPALVSDLAGRIVLSNAAARQAFGRRLEAMESAELLTRIAEASARPAIAAYISAPAQGHIEFAARDGRTFVLRRAAIISADGAVRGQIDYLTDISAIAQARRERERVLQLLSHDMRAPQAAILALLASEAQELDRARIARHARQTLMLAESFVDLARMQERGFEPEPVIAADLASEAADSLWPIAQQRGVRINVIDASDCAFVAAERESLFRAIVNLIDNAVKYSPEGDEVLLRIESSEGQVRLSVRDRGKGIDAAIMPHLFERFASEGAGQTVKGIGLGLNYVAAVVQRHGGTIRARNAEGGGAEFILALPLDAPN